MMNLIFPLVIILLVVVFLVIAIRQMKRRIINQVRAAITQSNESGVVRSALIRGAAAGRIDSETLAALKRIPAVSFEKNITLSLGGKDIGSTVAAAIQGIVDQVQASGVVDLASGVAGLPPEGELGVAEVLSVSRSISGDPEINLELDAIGAPKRRVHAQPLAGQDLDRGDRVYVRINLDDPSVVTILPPSATAGATPPPAPNRLDVLVLGPQLLKAGEKATGIVRQAESVPLAQPDLAERGFSKWRLDLDVRPERGFPYNAELTITLTTPEKVARVAHAGAEIALRYDPEDPKTLSIDSIAMGYGDPYEQARAAGTRIVVGTVQ